MANLEIITPDNPLLRRKARKAPQVTPELGTLIDDMIETMRAAQGVGLAAPQVARSLRLFVAEYAGPPENEGEQGPPPRLYVLINPETVRISDEMVEGTEGCLSIPGYAGTVERHEAITLKALDRQARPFRIKAKGWLARIFQHEMDHLDGVLFIDRASRVWRLEDEEEAPRLVG
ncbi:MAG: peptide deformylase [Chloroflexi bacterium]|nr:peptide deformylase [Chloroflexota bacterium]